MTTSATSFTSFSINTGFRYYFLTVSAGNNRPLATTLIDTAQAKACINSSNTICTCYGIEPNNYNASLYFSSDLKTVYLKTESSYDCATLYGVY